MAIISLSSKKNVTKASDKSRLPGISGKPTLSPAASIYASEQEKNNGGIPGGVGYFGEKVGLGIIQGVEGVIDYTTGGVAKLLGLAGVQGANEFAEDTFANDWLNYNHADDWYNPSEGWKVAGDIGSGVGSTLLAVGTTAAVALATGGASLIPTVAGLAVTGLSAAGTSTKEAYQESGNLGGKEFGYGTVMGGVEAGMEALGGKILGTGIGKTVDAVQSLLGKSAKTVAKSGAKAFVADMAGEFASEAFEEGFSTFISPYVKRATYNPAAENASIEEIAYSALVGGLSGVVMGGAQTGAVHGARTISGIKAEKQGKTGTIMRDAEVLSEEGATPEKTAKAIKETYDKLKTNIEKGGNIVNRWRLQGELQAYTTAASLSGAVKRSAITTINSAEAVAQKLNADGRYKIINDKFTFVEDASKIPEGATVRDITAEDITRGYDANAKDGIGKALKTNEILRYIAASDAAGRFMMGAKEIEAATLRGEQVRNEAEYNRLREEASAEERRAIANEIGVEDINTTSFEDFNAAVQSYKESGKADTYARKAAKIEEMKKLSDTKAKNLPKAIALADGNIQHYADANNDIAIARDGDSFIIYDFKTGNYTRSMTRAEVNAALAKGRVTNVTDTFTEQKATESDTKAESDAKAEATKLDALAKDKIKDYDHLSKANKLMVRDVIREALNKGLSEVDALTYARVSARTGLDISFDKQACYKGKNKAGADVYYAGYYDPDTNKIVVNPETKKKHASLLIHELSHATRAYLGKDDKIHYIFDDKAYTKISEDMQSRIVEHYADQDVDVSLAELILDESTAYYAEELFGTDRAIDLLLGEKQTLKEKILSFFKGAAKDYAADPKLAREARKQLKAFTRLFDNLSGRNFGRNAESGVTASKVNRRASFSSIAYSFFGDENMTSEEFVSRDFKKTDGYKQYVEQSIANMKQSHKGMTEAAIRNEIEKSIDGIVQVAVAMKRAGYDIHDTSKMRGAKDTKNRLLFSSLEPNSDYFTSSDISTICDKRKNFAEIYDDIVKEEERLGVPENKRFFKNVDNYFYIHKVLADKGLTQPCRECYVESMRKNLAPMANAFLELIRETDEGNTKNKQLYDKGKLKSGNAEKRIKVLELLNEYGKSANDITIEMLSTEDGLAQMKLQMPELYEVFNSFYGQSKPKMPKGATPFRFGELSALLTDEHGKIKTKLVDQIESTGGFRLQSYSDFQIQNYVDVLQVIFEAGTLGLTGHAYTKVPAFLDATKGTNLKRNISVFMYKDGNNWRVDRNDSFPYSLEEMYQLERDDKSGNTGIIVVSQNADNSAWIMANDLIAYGIPFHKSGLKMGVVRETIVREGGREIKGYQNIKDHTKQQSEVYARTEGDHKALNKVKKGINIYEFWDFDNKSGLTKNKLIEKNLKAYINKCEELGYLPKFREYVMDNAAVLNATLKYAKELGTVGKDATIDDISFKYKGYTIPYGYYKFLGDFSMFNTDGKASSHEVLSLANYDFDEAVKYFSNAEQLRRKEILQQFANGEERQKYANSTLNAEELTQIVEGKRKEIVNEIVYRSKGNIRAAMEETSIKLSKEFSDYPYNMQTVIKDYINYFDTDVENFIEDALAETNKKRLEYMHYDFSNDLPENVIKDINAITGFDVSDYGISINGEGVHHIKRRHGEHGKQDHSMRETKDIARIQYVLSNADKAVVTINSSGEIVKDHQYRNSDNTESNVVSITKRINGTYYVICAVPDSNAKKMRIKSAYISKKEVNQEFDANNAPNATSMTNLDITSKPIIPDSTAKSNTSDENSSKNSQGSGKRYSMDIDIEASRGSIVMDLDKRYKPTKKEAISDITTQYQIQFTNQQAGIEKVLKKNGYKDAEALVQQARAAVNAADSMIGLEQYRIGADKTEDIVKVGEGLSQIMKPIENATAIKDELKTLSKAEAEAKKQEYVSDFFTYLFHMHNVDRMSLKSKSEAELATLQSDVDDLTARFKDLTQKLQSATDKDAVRKELLKTTTKLKAAQKKVNDFEVLEDKPVIGRAVDDQGNTVITTVDDADGYKVIPFTADESKAISDELLKRHPEFAKSAEGIWNYSKNLNQYRVDTGLITKEDFDRMQELYPHYVPTYREGSANGIAALKGKYDVAVKSTVKGAKGSVRPLLRPDVIIARQTEETVKAGAINKLASTLYDVANGTQDVAVVNRSKAGTLVDYDPTQDKPKNNQVTFYKDGEKITMQVTSEVFAGFDGFNSNTTNAVMSTATAANNLFKKLVTSYSPLFILRNAVRDLQDAGINTKYGRSFIKNYLIAFKEIQTNGKYWQLYRAMGGLSSSLFDFDKGYSTTANKKGLPSKQGLKKILQSVENANVIVEQLPRLAEFISAINSGKSADQAILDAADVTTNFGRSGKLVRTLNRTFVPFLNPSVQGFSKIVRNVNDARKSVKGIITLLIKCILIGMVPMAINSLIYDDDEEYKQLRENDKENNYLIKLPDGTFLKIPRGRVVSVLAGAYNRTSQAIKGEDVDWGEYLENVSTQVSPVDGGVPRDILSPIRDVIANKTWYGTDIENQSDELVSPGERYDESTSAISKTIGGILNLSPKKINYLIDQYSGVAGDLILPTTSSKANKGYLLGNTTIDPVTQNKLSSSFYDALDQATYVKNSTSGKYTAEEISEAEAVYKYLNDIKSKVNDLNKAKREINSSSEISNNDKLGRVNDIQILINEYYKQALTDMSAFATMYSTTDDISKEGIYADYIATGVEEGTIKTLRYTETLRQLYGAEQALSEYNKAVYEKSTVYNSLGLSYDKFYDFYFTTRGLESDVDKDGETVSGSKRKKVVKALKKTKATKSEKVLMMYLAGYTVQDGDIAGVSASNAKRILLNSIMKLDVSKEEKAEIAKDFGFKVKNGRIIKDF